MCNYTKLKQLNPSSHSPPSAARINALKQAKDRVRDALLVTQQH